MANKHQSENICNICSKELGTKYNLKRHIKKVHTNIVKFGGNMEEHVIKPDKQSYHCEYCTKTYIKNYSLKCHIFFKV